MAYFFFDLCLHITFTPIFTVRNEVAKVMFLQVCVCPQGRGVPGPGGIWSWGWGLLLGGGHLVPVGSAPGGGGAWSQKGWYPSMH